MSLPISSSFSSGDLIADRRFEFGRELEARGDLEAAADLYAQAADAAPGFASAWSALGRVRLKLDDKPGAVDAFRRACAVDPEDRHGAALHLARLGVAADVDPAGYVRALFDQYAPRFDASLVVALNYRGPAQLHGAVTEFCRAQGRAAAFDTLLDLGCGTGLAGEAFRPHAQVMVGMDLSPAMLAQARAKHLYDRLVVADILPFLADEARAGTQADLVVAADVFVYIRELAPIMQAVAGVLKPKGLFAFTVETHEGEGVVLRESLRYAHAAGLVRATLDAAGFPTITLAPASSRNDSGIPVPGLVCVAQRK